MMPRHLGWNDLCYNPIHENILGKGSHPCWKDGVLPNIDKTQVLKSSAIFSGLNDDELGELAAISTENSFLPNGFIFWEGDEPECFYVVAEGNVKVLKLSSSGKEFIIAFFSPGEMFGEVAVFENKPYPATAQAVTETRVVSVGKDDFISFLGNCPQVSLRIINVLSGRLREAQGRLKDLAGERVEQRLAGMLLMLSAKIGLTLPFTRQEIADMAGTTTETAIRVLSHLKDRKIIRSVRGKVIILDEEKLRLLAEGSPRV